MTTSQAEMDLSPEELANYTIHSGVFSLGLTKDIDDKTIQMWLASPNKYKKELDKYAMYQYGSNGDVFQLFDLIRVLPNLNYRVKTLKMTKANEKHTLECKRTMKSIDHKELTRDMLSQLVSSGTVVGLWVGRENPKSKEVPHCMIFDDLEYFFPGRRVKGKWTVWCDLSYFDKAGVSDDKKRDLIDNLSPYIEYKDYEKYKKKGDKYRYVEFPVSRSVCIRTHTIKRNQRFGLPWNTQSIMDIKHKEKLRNLEKVASNKVMNAVAVLTLGLNGSDDSTYKKLGEKLTRSTFESVKKGLSSNEDGEASVVGLPEWAKLEYPSQETDVLNPDKMESINADIRNSTGISSVLTNGQGGNYASAKLNLDIIFYKIGELLEIIEGELYNKLVKIILPSTVFDDYYIEYEKNTPLTNKEKVDVLSKLHDKGYSLRYLIEYLGIDFNEFIENSTFEIDEMELRKKIIPPLSTYTATGEDLLNTTGEDSTNDNTIQSSEQDGNNNPKPSV